MRRTPPRGRFPRTRGGRFIGVAIHPVGTRGAQPTDPRLRLGAATVRSRGIRLLSLLAGAVLALTAGLGSGASFAYWTTTGTGFGAVTTATPEPVVVMAASGMVQGTLYPGGTADLRVAVRNPNTFPVTITGISQRVTPAVSVVDPQGVCEVTGVTIAPQVLSGLSIGIGSLSDVEVSIPGAAAMSMASDSGCQGAKFQIPVIVTVRS